MFSKIAIAALAAGVSAAPASFKHTNGTSSVQAIDAAYTYYQGDGSPGAGWPTMDAWGTFDELWETNSAMYPVTCGYNGFSPENSPEEIANIRTAIEQVSGETGVDARLILSIVSQESKGCVRVGNTDNGVHNPGLMQSHNGAGNCIGVSPCPQDQILQMIRDGTAGTADGDGLQQTIEKSKAQLGETNLAQVHYAAARMYNSGSVNWADLNDGITSTACYAVDVANRLHGFTDITGTSTCPL